MEALGHGNAELRLGRDLGTLYQIPMVYQCLVRDVQGNVAPGQ